MNDYQGGYPMPTPPEAEAPAAPPAPAPRKGRRTLATVLVCVLLAGAVGSAVFYTSMQVKDADRTAATKVWQSQKKPGSEEPEKWHSPVERTELGKRLLPLPDRYRLGPDIDGYGNDTVLTSSQASALFKQSVRGLPQDQRKAEREAIEKLRIQGIGMRSYASEDNDLVVEIQLAQMANKRAVEDMAGYQAEMTRRLGGFTKGPKIEGHKDAKCFMVPASEGQTDGLEMMICSAAEDDLLVTATAYGGKRMDMKAAASLLKKQLDHVVTPGEAV